MSDLLHMEQQTYRLYMLSKTRKNEEGNDEEGKNSFKIFALRTIVG